MLWQELKPHAGQQVAACETVALIALSSAGATICAPVVVIARPLFAAALPIPSDALASAALFGAVPAMPIMDDCTKIIVPVR